MSFCDLPNNKYAFGGGISARNGTVFVIPSGLLVAGLLYYKFIENTCITRVNIGLFQLNRLTLFRIHRHLFSLLIVFMTNIKIKPPPMLFVFKCIKLHQGTSMLIFGQDTILWFIRAFVAFFHIEQARLLVRKSRISNVFIRGSQCILYKNIFDMLRLILIRLKSIMMSY